MSNDAFAAVSTALQDVLREALGSAVVLDDPAKASVGDVSLWLYQVAVDEFTRNRPAPQVESASGRITRLRLPPLGVNLFYLVAPIFEDAAMAQNKLAAVMLALHENPLVAVEPVGAEVSEVVRVSFVPDTLEERTKVWEALSQPYRLSVVYQARTVRLMARQLSGDAPVTSLKADSVGVPGPGGAG